MPVSICMCQSACVSECVCLLSGPACGCEPQEPMPLRVRDSQCQGPCAARGGGDL